MSDSDGALVLPLAGRASGLVSYDADLGTLTVSFGSAESLDVDEVVDDVTLFFDGQQLGRLVKFQVLFPSQADERLRTVVADCLGGTLARRCLAMVDNDEDASGEEVKVPRREWARLRAEQWSALHMSWRAGYGLPRLPPVRSTGARRAATDEALLLVATPGARADDVVDVPSGFAAEAGIEGAVRVAVSGRIVRLVARRLPGAGTLSLQAEVIVPVPLTTAPVDFRAVGDEAAAEVLLGSPVDDESPVRVVVHLARPEPAAAVTSGEGALVAVLRDAGRPTRRLVGMREELQPAVSWASVEVGHTADRIFWRNTGKPPVEVVVVREGGELWARGFAKKSRRSKPVRVECRLRPEAVAALAPNGRTDADAGRLSGASTVGADGYFHMRLAAVRTGPFIGELVDQLGLEVG